MQVLRGQTELRASTTMLKELIATITFDKMKQVQDALNQTGTRMSVYSWRKPWKIADTILEKVHEDMLNGVVIFKVFEKLEA